MRFVEIMFRLNKVGTTRLTTGSIILIILAIVIIALMLAWATGGFMESTGNLVSVAKSRILGIGL